DDLPSSSSTQIPSDGLDDIDEGIIEYLIIIALAGALAFLIYYRNQRQTNHRRGLEGQQQQPQQQQQQGQVPDGQQADGGFFPPPGDPGYPQWVAGGVGH
ncbi:ERAD-associated protein, partial [Peltigera leucophlebia]|nr:ERAD-associated protein [Peltigera leucophlebia]